MDLNYRVNHLFPVSIHEFSVDGFDEIKSELINYAYDLKDQDPDGNKISNVGGWQSKGFNIKNDDVLHNFLKKSIVKIPNINNGVEINIYAWININKSNDYNIKHNHPSSDLAGVLWVKCPEKCGDIIFDNPTGFEDSDTLESYTQEFKKEKNFFHTYWFPPTEGRMIIFPAHLNHRVLPNESNEDRISVSFNIRLNR